ncbi:TPA: restriction endonuclease subunit S [Enterococcus faecium]|nr:restriction endonuclease subunit S [Enterococcus faecium]HBA0706114.1 restriction endonuclease subunit S [Enterococcus faecium]
MFPKTGEDKPEIRFAGFTDAWEQRKLGEVATRVTRKNKKLESTLPLTISAQFGLVDQNTFFNKQIASKDVSGYYLLKKGEFAYNKSYSNGYPWGAVKRLDKYDMGVLSTLYICFRPVDINSDFLASYYDTDRWYKEVSKHAAEGARNHGLLNIAASDFFETELMIPKNNNEQEKIADFFKSLDTTITLHQRELDSLKEMKKTLLQKMFV